MPASAPPTAPGSIFPRRLTEVLADMSCVVFRREMSPEGEIRYSWFSDNLTEILGYRADEMTVSSKGALNAIHWADRDGHVSAIRHSAQTLSRCLEVFRAVTAGGETRWFRGSSSPALAENGDLVWEGAWIDISPWMRAEHQFQTVMDHAEDCILTLDTKNGIDWANAAAERLFGWTLDDMRGRSLSDLLEQPCRQEVPGRLSTQEVMAKHSDGTIFPFEMTVSEVRSDGRMSLIVIGRDITRRRTTELMLEETERRLRSIASNLPGVVFQRVQDTDGTFSYPYVSQGIEEILGCNASDIVSDSSILFDAMIDEDRERLMAALIVSADTLEPVREDVRVTGLGGRLRWLRGQSRPRHRPDSHAGSIVWDGLILDVTDEVEERRKAEKAVRESEERFRLAFAAASLGIIVLAMDGTIQQCNPAFLCMCGRAEGELNGTSIEAFIDIHHLTNVESLALQGEPFCLHYTPHLPDGAERHWRVTGTHFSATPNAAAPSLLLLVEDVTEIVRAADERRQLEFALQEGHKLEALGRLAGGVAHELNNMLGPILMAAEMVERSVPLDERNLQRTRRIIDAAKHGRDIVRNVLSYCRKEEKASLGAVDVVPVFVEFADLAASILPPSVKVETHIEVESAIITGDVGQITQVLLNLTNNARDAMDGSGTLTLTLVVVNPGELVPPGQTRGGRRPDGSPPNPFTKLDLSLPHVEIRISDTGSGMRLETAAKIFDPFFTTKPVGQGTGLGLSVVQGIIKAMGGVVAVDSELGEGTTFRIVLPTIPRELAA